MPTVRKTRSGTFELRITHRTLKRPYYSTHDTAEAANDYGARLVALLDQGIVPPELQARPARARRTPLASVLGEYLAEAPIAPTDRPLVVMLRGAVAGAVEDVTVAWVDLWIRAMKRDQHLAPGTIRKRVESLARAIDWWNLRQHPVDALPANPLRLLRRGYSSYAAGDAAEPRVDARRDRRLLEGETEAIELAILGAQRADRQRPLAMPHREAVLLLWRVLVNTGCACARPTGCAGATFGSICAHCTSPTARPGLPETCR